MADIPLPTILDVQRRIEPARLTLETTDPTAEPAWDASMPGHPQAGFFHTAAWAAVLKATYNFVPLYMVVRSETGTRALWPIMEVNSRLTGCRGVSLPFTDECGPLIAPGVAAQEMLSNALDLGRSRGWRYFEFRGGGNGFPGIQPSVSFYSHTICLCADTETLFRRCDGSVRRAVRKARQQGLCVEVSREAGDMETFYRLQCRTRRKHGLPPQPVAFFRNIHRHVVGPGRGITVTARHKEKAVASAVYFQHGSRALYKFGASDPAFAHLRTNNLVMWSAIEHFARDGCQALDLGRTSLDNAGLRRFKLGWGAEERELPYFRYDFRKAGYVKTEDRASGWHNRIFRLLPLPVSRMIGAALYRHLG